MDLTKKNRASMDRLKAKLKKVMKLIKEIKNIIFIFDGKNEVAIRH